jgi:hypothetical protein
MMLLQGHTAAHSGKHICRTLLLHMRHALEAVQGRVNRLCSVAVCYCLGLGFGFKVLHMF